MANYTTRVYDILNSLNENNVSGYSINDVIDKHWKDIFDLEIWNTYDPEYKKTLCCKILRHYLMYEIGSETYSLWKLNLNEHLAEIMPKYNVLYENIDRAYSNFFKDVDYTETNQRTEEEGTEATGTETGTSKEGTESTSSQENETSTTSSTNGKTEGTQTVNASTESSGSSTNNSTNAGNSDGWQASSDTPQGGLDGIEDNKYLSAAVHNYGKTDASANTEATQTGTSESTNTGTTTSKDENTSETSGTATATANTTNETNTETSSNSTANTSRNLTENYVKTVIGKMGSENNAKLFNEISSSIVNIDLMIIKELKENFILLWE